MCDASESGTMDETLNQSADISMQTSRKSEATYTILITILLPGEIAVLGILPSSDDKLLKLRHASWTAIYLSYVHSRHREEAISFFSQMQKIGLKLDNVAFFSNAKNRPQPRQCHNYHYPLCMMYITFLSIFKMGISEQRSWWLFTEI